MKRVKSLSFLTIMILILASSISSLAKTETFGGTMYYKVIDGASNKIFYHFDGNKNISMSGDIKVIDTTNYNGKPNTTYICLYEKTGRGKGKMICEGSTVAYFDGQLYHFSGSGKTTNTSDNYYIYCYKVNDDGFDISIKGTLTSD